MARRIVTRGILLPIVCGAAWLIVAGAVVGDAFGVTVALGPLAGAGLMGIATVVAITCTCALLQRHLRAVTVNRRAEQAAAALLGLFMVPVGIWAAMVWALVGHAETFEIFTAPNGPPYLLQTDARESGRVTVYRMTTPITYTLDEHFGARYLYPVQGAHPPCHGHATDTQIVVECAGGAPLVSAR